MPDLEGRTAISKFMSLLLNSYTKYFNYNKEHSGRIFQGPYKSKLIKDNLYLQSIIIYINFNPIKHKIVKNIADWHYTSHHEFISKVYNDKKITVKSEYFNINDYKKAIKDRFQINKKIDLEFY